MLTQNIISFFMYQINIDEFIENVGKKFNINKLQNILIDGRKKWEELVIGEEGPTNHESILLDNIIEDTKSQINNL